MDLKIVMLLKVSWTEKDKYHMYKIPKEKIRRNRNRVIDTENKQMVA